MKAVNRKEAVRHYKENPPPRGVFALRHAVTGRAWVGASRNLDAARNSTLFLLRQGEHRDRALQAEWTAHGEGAFRFDVLETLAADVSEFGVTDELKSRMRAWAEQLDAPTLLP